MAQTPLPQRIGIIGGALDMIHLGHLRLAEISCKYVEQVWLQPCWSHMHAKKMTAANHRLAMCRLGANQVLGHLMARNKIVVSDYEIQQEVNECSHQMLMNLWAFLGRVAQPRPEVHMIIGQDQADQINTWAEWEELIANFPFIIYPRAGFDANTNDDVWYKQGPHCFLEYEAGRVPQAASSELKKKIGELDESNLVPSSVRQYIMEHTLYT